MWSDIAIGLIVGVAQGVLLRWFYPPITDYFLLLILKATKKGSFSIVFAHIIVLVFASVFFIGILLFKPLISFWDNFMAGWMLGFCLGVFAFVSVFRKSKKTKIIDRID